MSILSKFVWFITTTTEYDNNIEERERNKGEKKLIRGNLWHPIQ